MTFSEAHRQMDLLLDKADQPYFITSEKDKFLNMALMEWFEEQAALYDASGDNANMFGTYVVKRFGRFGSYNPGSALALDTGIIHTKTRIDQDATSGQFTQPYSEKFNFNDGGLLYPLYKLLHLEVRRGVSEDEKYRTCKRLNVDEGTYDDGRFQDPFNKPELDFPKYFFKEGDIKVLPDNISSIPSEPGIMQFRITYVTYPIPCNVEGGNIGIPSPSHIISDFVNGTADVELGARCLGVGPGQWNAFNWSKEQGIAVDEQHKIIKRAVRMMTANIESASYPIQRQEDIESR